MDERRRRRSVAGGGDWAECMVGFGSAPELVQAMPDNPILRSNSSIAHLTSRHAKRRNLVQLDHQTYFDHPNSLLSNKKQSPFGFALDDEERIDSKEIFDLIRSITDPEHPLTLQDLSVVSTEQISVTYPDDFEESPHVIVRFTPTIPHCSMATLIGLTLRVRLLRSLPERFKVDIKIKEGTPIGEISQQERVAAALENNHLLGVVEQCLKTAHLRGNKDAPSQ